MVLHLCCRYMLRNMTDLGLPMEQMVAISPVVHRLAVEDMKLNLADFFDRRYDEAQLLNIKRVLQEQKTMQE